MPLTLKKPLLFLDIEATGLNVVKDRLVEISLLKMWPDGKEECKTWRVNPEREIPPNIARLIKITNEDVQDLPKFKQVAKDIARFFEGADLAGYNLYKLDLPLLLEEFLRAGVDYDLHRCKVIDVQRIFHIMEQRTLSAAYQFYCKKELTDRHSALADTLATKDVLLAQLDKYDNLGHEVEQIAKFGGHAGGNAIDIVGRIVKDEHGIERFNFGKFKGESVAEVLKKEPGYYSWMMNGEFTEYTKKKLTEIKLRMMNG